jgi:hypothetical protein
MGGFVTVTIARDQLSGEDVSKVEGAGFTGLGG